MEILCKFIPDSDGYINGAITDSVLDSKDKVKGLLANLKCSVFPRPPACDMQITQSPHKKALIWKSTDLSN